MELCGPLDDERLEAASWEQEVVTVIRRKVSAILAATSHFDEEPVVPVNPLRVAVLVRCLIRLPP
jgi:hypothetical protein